MGNPIKRHPAIVEYSKDHHFGLLLVWKIRQGVKYKIEKERIGAYVYMFFQNDLKSHFDEEEKFLLPLLPQANKLRVKLEEEHKELKQYIAAIIKDDFQYETLNKFANLLESHIRFEEREFFQHLQKVVDLDTVYFTEKKKNHNQKDLDQNWKDKFWENKASQY